MVEMSISTSTSCAITMVRRVVYVEFAMHGSLAPSCMYAIAPSLDSAARLFPYKLMFRWLAYSNGEDVLRTRIPTAENALLRVRNCRLTLSPATSRLSADPDSLSDAPSLKRDFFHRREFNFTLENDVFVRYLCFRDADELAKAIQIKQPHKIDIGPVYTALVRAALRTYPFLIVSLSTFRLPNPLPAMYHHVLACFIER